VSKLTPALLALALAILLPMSASAQDTGRLSVRGYGGATFGSSDAGGDNEHAATVAGGVGWDLSEHFALTGDVGYINTVPSQQANDAVNRAAALIVLVSGLDAIVTLKAPTFYATGGARFTLGHRQSRLRPFAEGQAGIARTSFSLDVSGSDPTVVNDAKQAFRSTIGADSATEPAVAAVGGVDIRMSRHIAAEASYRYLRLLGDAKTNIHQLLGGVRVTF
jgi:opacity protein-like surface antigen